MTHPLATTTPARSQSQLHRLADRFTEALIYFAVVFGPWAFGTTQLWSIHVMNGVGMALGLLWLGRLRVRREVPSAPRLAPGARRERQFTGLLAAGTICILLYCLASAWNARAIYHPDRWSFEYLNAIAWLPHSYDQANSWAAFWKYLGLAGLFWALRDWLLTPSAKEDYGLRTTDYEPPTSGTRLPIRLRRLFWILALNGMVLAAQGLMQRAEGGHKLLWLIVPRYNQDSLGQFGPYAYRANAAQYFNLLWPAVLGFWWASVSLSRRRKSGEHSTQPNRAAALLPCVLIMAICPLVTTSRGGAIVLVMNLILSGGILLMALWRSRWTTKALMLLLLAGVVVGGALLGWNALAPRMEILQQGFEDREGIRITGGQMAQDNALFGTGPGTFDTMYQLYLRSEADVWHAYMHNDWLETLITFGRVGAIPVLFTLLLVFSRWFWGGGIQADKSFVMLLWVSVVGCMIHSCFDFPFQIHSVLALFLVLCAVLSCLGRRTSAA